MNTQDLITALGPIADLYQDDTIQEIMVDGSDQIYVQREGVLEDLGLTFSSDKALLKMINDVLALADTDASVQAVTADIRLPDDSRFRAVLPPTAVSGPYLVISKPFIKQMTWENLLNYGSLDTTIIEIIDSAIQAEANILVSGGTASGKTTLLNMIAGRLPADKRIVAVENIHHLKIQHNRVIYLEAQASKIPLDDLIEMGSRMNPDWMIVNKLNGPEVFKTLQILNGGYSGIVNMHAENLQDALNRLETFCLMANQGLAMEDIKRLVAGGIWLALQLNYLPSKKRRVVEMVEIQGIESGRYLLQPLVRYLPEMDAFESLNIKSSWQT